MTINITPFVGAGNIKLGTERAKLREQYQNKYSSRKSGDDVIDYFLNNQITADYDDNKASFIGLNAPLKVEYNGLDLFNMSYEQIYDALSVKSKDVYGDISSLTFMDLGITFYFERGNDIPNFPLQVGIFTREYYRNSMHTFKRIE
ncbi:hypothetical protein [Chitinophaga defluvii]|uniref:Uncharacterized protein n=1 Tax=Chitinophaga defluvii TaxID=3163343 RepID=A0ABV2TES4_9BACT